MYGWIWRHLPFGLWGKVTGSVLLAAATGVLLWFVVFPAVEPLLPFGDVQVSQDGNRGGGTPGLSPGPGGTPTVNPSDFVVPYSTVRNRSAPGTSPAGR